MDDVTFERFRTLIYEKSGITLGPQKRALVSSRILKRMRQLSLSKEREYLSYVLSDTTGDELVLLLDAISTNVTSFFREPKHFDLLRDWLLQWRNAGLSRFRVWCAASSTGEEPYSIAMVALDTLGQGADFRLLATDISTRALKTAVAGSYPRARLEAVPPPLRARFFEAADQPPDSLWRASPALRNVIAFNRLNLATPPFPMKGPLDAVFCRNVMIYFDNSIRQALVMEIHRLLKPGGYLVVGHSESLSSIKTPFTMVEPSVYRKT